MTMIYVGAARKSDLAKIDTKRLARELDAISRGAQLITGEANGRRACWVECFRPIDDEIAQELVASVAAQAVRLRVELT